jgi:hypothetical protein
MLASYSWGWLVLHRLLGGEAMSEVLSQFVNEFYVFALTALGMVLAYFGKLKDKQDKEK